VLGISAMSLGFTLMHPWKEQDRRKDQVAKDILIQSLGRDHYLTLNINDQFSNRAFDMYLERLDPGKRLLLASDVVALKAYRDKLDDELNGQFGGLLEISQKLINERTTEALAYIKEILSKPFDFNDKETLETDPNKKTYPSTKQAIKEEWRKFLEYTALVQFQNKVESQQKSKEQAQKEGKPFETKSNDQIQEEVRKQILKNYTDYFDRLIKRDDEDHRAELFNAVCLTYCPHTEYFAPIEKDNFDIDMSGKLEGIGATLQQTDGETKIVRVVAGSPSWKSKQVEADDIILKVAQEDDEPVSITGMSMKDVLKLIRGKKGTKVRLTLRKKDGRITEVSLIRDVIVIEESYVKSTVIEDKKTQKRYGYILLPSFYADFGNSDGRFCAKDVATELEKLKALEIDGLILDLRNNGGGSLSDAIKMSGLFIESGPVVQVRDRSGRSYPYHDDDSKVQYDGPLVVMVNRFSASASEILAAALQDYRRAVIVGSKSTFGKGTVQRFVDMDNYLPFTQREYQPLGSLKLTIQKFYRISGGSTQLKGVEPDVVLPDPYNYIKSGEAELPNVMPYDNIPAARYTVWNENNTKDVVKNSSKRVKENHIFQLIEENSLRIKKNREKTLVSLNIDDFVREQKRNEEEAKKFDNLKMQNDFFSMITVEPIVPSQNTPETQAELNERWYREIREDAYIYESTRILNDLKK
jgi:carboxyl-terminal processing protease